MPSDEIGPLEAIYDAEIAPLMEQIIEISKRTGIPVFASCQLDGEMACTTFIAEPVDSWPADDREHYARWRRVLDRAAYEVQGGGEAYAITITSSAPSHTPTRDPLDALHRAL